MSTVLNQKLRLAVTGYTRNNTQCDTVKTVLTESRIAGLSENTVSHQTEPKN